MSAVAVLFRALALVVRSKRKSIKFWVSTQALSSPVLPVIPLLILQLAFQPLPGQTQPSFERFKELISSPPVIEELVAERRYQGTKPTDYYYARWQSNAFLISTATNRQYVRLGGGHEDLAQVYSRYDDLYWTVFGANRPLKIGYQADISPTNELAIATYWASIDLGRILNFGVDHFRPGEIKWTGNAYRGTNHSGRAIVLGEARTNISGVVTQLIMNIAGWPQPSIPGEGPPQRFYWELDYEYDASISDAYPSVIKRYVIRTNERRLRDEIRIHFIKPAARSLPRELFAYEPFLNANSLVLRATNNTFYYKDRRNVSHPVQQAPPSP